MDHPYADGVEPLRLDREVATTARRWVAWRRALREGRGLELDPFELTRPVSGATTLHAALDLVESDPLRLPLARWVHRLTEQRVNLPARIAVEQARRHTSHVVENPEYGKWTPAELLRKALTDVPERAQWLDVYARCSTDLAALVATHWERRAELNRRLKLDVPTLFERCADDVEQRAMHWLAATRDAHESLRLRSPSDFITAGLAEDAQEGWPGRPTPHALRELLGALVEGLDLEPGPLPQIVSAASYLRCFARVGGAVAVASAPRDQPFVIAHDPYGLSRFTLGALFASLPLSSAFAARRLGVARSRQPLFLRSVALSLLLASRAAAVRVLLRSAALAGRAKFADTFAEAISTHLFLELPTTACGALFAPRADGEQRFVSIFLAAHQARALKDVHDEDWFLNPRATTEIRENARLVPPVYADAAELDAGEAACLESITEALG